MPKAKNLSGQAPGGKRTKLADMLPLKTPFVVQVFPIYACNFKCIYCIFQKNKEERGFISNKISMDYGLFKKCVDGMVKFPDKIKVLRFVGIGEPLMHKQIVEMVEYAASKNIANKIEILTNASLLTKTMSDDLIKAGISRLVISLQGTTRKKYKEVCDININFNEFVNNLRYFFNNKKNVEMYIKIIDCALDGEKDEQRFYDIFGGICDTIAIEHTVPIHSSVDYRKILKDKDMSLTQFGLPVSDVKICPQPFFHMQINPDGKVVPCYAFEYPIVLGDCNKNKESIFEIWQNKKFQSFRRKMLDGINTASQNCRKCELIKYRLFAEDVLNNDAEKLKEFYE